MSTFQPNTARGETTPSRTHLIGLLFFAVAAVLAGTTAFLYEVGQRVIYAEEEMSDRLMNLQQLDDFLSSLKDAETGQRGYLLTGEDTYMTPYLEGRETTERRLATLQRLGASGELRRDRVERVADLTKQKLAEMEQTVQLRRTRNTNAALALVRSDAGKHLMDEVRNNVAQMRAYQQQQFIAAASRTERATNLRNGTYAGLGLVNLLFLGWAYRKISLEVRRREAAILETSRQKEILAAILTSVGDGVIATDGQGRVIFLNTQAELLTGWNSAEAAGRLLSEVFPIVNETTRLPVENPTQKVLRLGVVVGLANHTLLLCRDGREIPIDDSAAPIRGADGSTVGVVLIFRDFTDRRRVEKALREAHEQLASRALQLETLVQQRTASLNEMIGDLEAFSYSLVHDMRGPLRAMQSFAQMMAEECSPLNPAADGYLQRIKRAAQRLDRLIQDGFNYSRMIRGEVPIIPVDPGELLRGMIETYPAFQRPQAEIIFDSKLPRVMANEAMLTQCFSNLLGNAVKFVDSGINPRIEIWGEATHGRARLYVKDNGVGIALDQQAKIFEIFQRLDTKYEGTGVGLAIVKKAVERMGGKCGVQSEPGKGSTFWLDLAAAETEPPAP